VERYNSAGVFQQLLSTGVAGATFTTGSAFDASGNFYVTNFGAGGGAISQFDNLGVLLDPLWAQTGQAGTESILFDAAGNAFVGVADGNTDIYRFDAAGVQTGQFNVAIQLRGSDWIDLAADQTTMFYTSEGTTIFRYDVGADAQLANFASSATRKFALRLLGDGGLLVAGLSVIERYNAAGVLSQTYDFAGQNTWFSLNLDPDGTSFWSGDAGTFQLHKFDIASGAHLQTIQTAGNGGVNLFGVSVFGEITQATVPEPAAFFLLVAALIGLGAAGSRRGKGTLA
jgi:sugar lactone lactonase YvrE